MRLGEPLPAALRRHGKRLAQAMLQSFELLCGAAHFRLRRLAGEPVRQTRQRDVPAVERAGHDIGEPRAGLVMVLTRQMARSASPWGRARVRARQSARRWVEKTQDRIRMAAGEIGELGEQFATHRHGLFGGAGRRWGAQVRDMIEQRPIGLMADGGDQRDEARCRRAHDDLLVEAPEVFERAAAARDDENIRARPPRASR